MSCQVMSVQIRLDQRPIRTGQVRLLQDIKRSDEGEVRSGQIKSRSCYVR